MACPDLGSDGIPALPPPCPAPAATLRASCWYKTPRPRRIRNPPPPPSAMAAPSLATLAIHADDDLATAPSTDVAPAIHVSTIFHYPRDPERLVTVAEQISAVEAGEVAAPPPLRPLSLPLPSLLSLPNRY